MMNIARNSRTPRRTGTESPRNRRLEDRRSARDSDEMQNHRVQKKTEIVHKKTGDSPSRMSQDPRDEFIARTREMNRPQNEDIP